MAREEMFRQTADGSGLELTPQGQRMAEEAAAVQKALRQTPQREIDRSLADAERKEIFRLEALAQTILRANPFREDEEEIWTELARTVALLRPLVLALEKADERGSEYATYRYGYRFRLTEAIRRITEIIEYNQQCPIQSRRNGIKGGRPPKVGGSDAVEILALECAAKLKKRLGQEPKALDVWKEMISRIDRGLADVSLSLKKNDEGMEKIELCDNERLVRSIAKGSFRTIFSNLKRKPSTEPGFR